MKKILILVLTFSFIFLYLNNKEGVGKKRIDLEITNYSKPLLRKSKKNINGKREVRFEPALKVFLSNISKKRQEKHSDKSIREIREQISLEKKLIADIEEMNGVITARLHISESQASLILKLSENYTLPSRQIEEMILMISYMVHEIRAENVRVLSNDGEKYVNPFER
jgi:hypothetical protein